jgi:uncharacterized protein YkwD
MGAVYGNSVLMQYADQLTVPANHAGVPGISLPAGFDAQGLPVASSCLGPDFSEASLLRIGMAGLACQSQELISSPAAKPPDAAQVEGVHMASARAKPNVKQVNLAAEKEAVSSIGSHSVLGYSIEPVPTISPDTGLNGAELIQLGSLPVATGFNPPAGCEASTDADIKATILRLVNEERARYGLGKLTEQYQLNAAADVHTVDMACKNFFSHTGSDSSSPFDRIKTQGYVYNYAGENLFAGNGVYNDAGQAVSAWMNSAGHRQNILKPEYTEAGVSYVFNPDSAYGGYFSIVFARP